MHSPCISRPFCILQGDSSASAQQSCDVGSARRIADLVLGGADCEFINDGVLIAGNTRGLANQIAGDVVESRDFEPDAAHAREISRSRRTRSEEHTSELQS